MPGIRSLILISLFLPQLCLAQSFSCKSYAVFDEKKSHFHLPDETETKAFMNIFFDLCEIERRKMEHTLSNAAFTVKQIDSVYYVNLGNMKKITSKYLEEVKLGKNKRAFSKWNAYVVENLGIDNVKIFREKDAKLGVQE
jgi:hypothetical protein